MQALIQNRKAYFNYEITDKFSAGLELLGFEVKAVKNSRGSLDGAYVTIRGGEAFLVGATISPYQMNNTPKDYDPMRIRRILLTKKEIMSLAEVENEAGLTIVALAMYNNDGRVKLEIGIGRGKKKFDKRASIQKRETDREIQRSLKRE